MQKKTIPGEMTEFNRSRVHRFKGSAQLLAAEAASLIEKETLVVSHEVILRFQLA